MPALVPVLLSRLPQLALALLLVVAIVLPALAQDLQPDPGPELLQPPAPAPAGPGAEPVKVGLVEALVAIGVALAALVEVGRRLLTALAQLRAAIRGAERGEVETRKLLAQAARTGVVPEDAEKVTKRLIRAEAEAAGVQPALHKRVQKETA